MWSENFWSADDLWRTFMVSYYLLSIFFEDTFVTSATLSKNIDEIDLDIM